MAETEYRDPRCIDPETGEQNAWPLEIKLLVSIEALQHMSTAVWLKGTERLVAQFRADAKALYRRYHPDAVFPDEQETPEGGIDIRTQDGLSIEVREALNDPR